jgi:uncharacterized protein with NRDE domain
MCTVSFIPVGNKFYITSNRDEKLTRKTALQPAVYKHEGVNILFPKDADAGGTWIAAKENGDAAVVLNGAFISHMPDPPYRRSRGLILLDLLAYEKPATAFSKIVLDEIEPFTVVIYENKSLFEFRWDGNERYGKRLSHHQSYIWSSATLYDGLTVKKREQWFNDFLERNSMPSQQTIINFHRFTGDGDASNDLLMSRDGLYNTVSITSIELNGTKTRMQYLDLRENISSLEEIFYSPETGK